MIDEELAKIEKRARGWSLIDRGADEGGPVSNPAAEDVLVLVAEVRALREVLKAIEWVKRDEYERLACPACGAFAFAPDANGRLGGHAPDCALAAVLWP